MAFCNKAHAVKAVLLAGFLLLFLNILGTRNDKKFKDSFYFSHNSQLWPKRTRSSNNVISNTTQNNIYTILWNSNNSSIKNITFNSPIISNNFNNNSILLIESSDFKRKFSINSLESLSMHSNKTNNTDKNISNDQNNNNGGFFESFMTKFGFNMCPLVPPNLDGPIETNTTIETLETIEKRLGSNLFPGGFYQPKECYSRDHVAIIVPFRDRYVHLPIFLKNLHPFLMKQQIEYGIFLVEQTNGKAFNRAALMNIGYLEALKVYKWDCFIFHDVDLLPLDDRNLYTCPDQPRHMSVAIDVFGYKLPYSSIFGGVSAMTTSQFKTVNGFSNSFWGWGGEDDDMSNRLKHAGFHISRYPMNIARYIMLNHQKEKANPKRYENLVNGAKKFATDGINSIKYDIYSSKKFPLFTWFLVELKMTEHS